MFVYCIITLHFIIVVNVKMVYYVTKTCSTAVIKKKKKKKMVKLTDKDKTKQNNNKQNLQQQQKCVVNMRMAFFCECVILFPGWLRIGRERSELGDGITTVTGPGGQ